MFRNFDRIITEIMQFSHDRNLNLILEKVEAGERLICSEGVELYKIGDLNALWKLADFVRREINIV